MITTFAEGLLWTLIAIAALGIIVSVILIVFLRKAELRTAQLAQRLAQAERHADELAAELGRQLAQTHEKICDTLTVHTARLDRMEKAEENADEDVAEIRLVVNDIMESIPDASTPADAESRPTLDAYNEAVHAFTELAKDIASMKRAAKPALHPLFAALANYENGTATARTAVRDLDLNDDTKARMLNLVTQIENFHAQRRPVIDAWLAASPAQGISSYVEAVRMPLGLTFDPDFDEHILQEPFDDCEITRVHSLGYHFPGNTIHPFRQKASVS